MCHPVMCIHHRSGVRITNNLFSLFRVDSLFCETVTLFIVHFWHFNRDKHLSKTVMSVHLNLYVRVSVNHPQTSISFTHLGPFCKTVVAYITGEH